MPRVSRALAFLLLISCGMGHPPYPDYPPHWSEVPTLSDLPIRQGHPVVNPWNYTERLALYKSFFPSTRHCLWGNASEPDPNPMWANTLQHGWQYWSGRLRNSNSSLLFPGTAWWGCGNYYLSVLMYLGANQAGVVPTVEILPPIERGSPEYCLETPCPLEPDQLVVDGWAKLFGFLKSSAEQCSPTSKPVPEDPLMAEVLAHYWHAHEGAVSALMHTCSPLQAAESLQEQAFFNSWGGTFVHMLGPALMPGSRTLMNTVQKDLPFRPLQAGDHPPFIHDMSSRSNEMVATIDSAGWMDKASNGTLRYDWARTMCVPAAREIVQQTFFKEGVPPYGQLIKIAVELIVKFARDAPKRPTCWNSTYTRDYP